MAFASARRRVIGAAEPHLAEGERVLASGFAWAAERRPRVPLVLLARHPHLLGLTDRRVMLWSRPRRRRPLDDEHLVLDAPFPQLTLDALRTRRLMLQVELLTADGRALVLELRPRDRGLGRRLALELRRVAAEASAGASPPSPTG